MEKKGKNIIMKNNELSVIVSVSSIEQLFKLYYTKMSLIKDAITFIDFMKLSGKKIMISDVRDNICKYLYSENIAYTNNLIDALISMFSDVFLDYINDKISADDVYCLESGHIVFNNYFINRLKFLSPVKCTYKGITFYFNRKTKIDDILMIKFELREHGYIRGIAVLNNNKNLIEISRKEMNKFIKTIHIIKSSHNHVTLNHKTINTSVLIDYNDGIKIKPLKFNIHYCETCKVFYDFENSFYNQYKSIDYDKLIIIINRIDDKFLLANNYFNGLEKSLLSKLGYKVGKSGLNKWNRRKILKYAIESGLMSVAEIKSHLEFCIQFFKNKNLMEKSITDWKEDMIYISLNQATFNESNKKYF